ncbi:MAG: lysophospholipid acyltransferase family protein [Bacteroidia bacterium]
MLYRLILLPLSYLPLRVLYGLSGLLYFILRHVAGYRKQVIERNISIAFPDWNKEEKKALFVRTYWHLADLLIEGIKNLSMKKIELQERMIIEDPALFADLYAKGRHVILLSSHLENWEFFISAQAFLLPHRAFGIGKKLTKDKLNEQLNSRRERFGMRVIHAKNYREILKKELAGPPLAVLTLGDQSPAPDNAFWLPFFSQKTAFAFGGEFMAHEYGMAVVYLRIKKVKRGYYRVETELLCEDPKSMDYGEITKAYVSRLQRDIEACPDAWLWTHKRWKIPVPADLSARQEEHESRFKKRFSR